MLYKTKRPPVEEAGSCERGGSGMKDSMNAEGSLKEYEQHLRENERSEHTIEKYLRDVRSFLGWKGEQELTRQLMIRWKQSLVDAGYQVRSINSMLASVNSYLRFIGQESCRTGNLKLQRQLYSKPQQELSRNDYMKLLAAAAGNARLQMLLQTICSTGIRVSELEYFTLEAVKTGEVTVSCKKKSRTVLLPGKLKKALVRYARENRITSGIIFRTRNGTPLNRSNIWVQMKALCQAAGVEPSKVFPHNLRKLFARSFYRISKDIAKLADVLGHSSIDTTRIYIMTTGSEHLAQLERLALLL